MTWVVAALGLLAANGAFVAFEFALVGSRRSRLESRPDAGARRVRLALRSMARVDRELAGAQLGITIASLSLGYVAEPAVVAGIEDLLGGVRVPGTVASVLAVILGLGVVVFAHMVVGEMVPKNLAFTSPERTLLGLARINRWYLAGVGPVVWVLNSIANGVIRLLGITPASEVGEAAGPKDLLAMLSASRAQGHLDRRAHRLLTGAVEFSDRTVGAVMVQRRDMVVLRTVDSVADAEALVARTGHSRLPVLDEDGNEPLGFVHAKDLLALSGSAGALRVPLRLVRRLPVVSPDHRLGELLIDMRRTGVHLAVVVASDGDRSVIGMVTLDDLLEDLVGGIADDSGPA